MGAVRPAAPATPVVRIIRVGDDRAPGRPIPGYNAFDRAELSGLPSAVDAYAQFTVHPKTGVVAIKIVNAQTDEVIREIPAEVVIQIAEQLQAYLEMSKKGKGNEHG
ncbi:MAG: flagellar protein FlaG [Chloroflexi bacterium]|nr:flagellar protein FlaG [Chloroflexota bacterium]